MSSCLLFVSALLLGVCIFLHHVDLLLKVLGSWTWWCLLFYILFLIITPSQSLVLDFCFLLKHLTIDFPSHFILSIIDVHLDSASRDKLIFPSAITRILRHFSIPFPSSDHFSIMCAIDYTTVKHSEAQFRSRQTDSASPSSRSAPSRSTPSISIPSSSGDVSLGDVLA